MVKYIVYNYPREQRRNLTLLCLSALSKTGEKYLHNVVMVTNTHTNMTSGLKQLQVLGHFSHFVANANRRVSMGDAAHRGAPGDSAAFISIT